MLFDWFTFGAQVLNFLILVWVLKHFLYKPILNAIDARERLVAKDLAGAAASKAEAQKEHEEFQHKNEEFDKQRAALLSKATDEANAERQRLLGEARRAADALSAKRQEAMRNDARNLEKALGHRTQQEVFAIARKALTDLAATSLEGRMVEAFTLRLRGMEGRARVHMGEALKTASEPVLVRSAFDLPQEQREAVQKAINETFSADIRLRFETAPELVSGIDVSANGQRVGWSIENYLTSLEKGVSEILKKKERPEAKPEPAPRAKTDPNPEATAASEPDANVDPEPEVVVAPKPEAKVEPKAEAAANPVTKAKPKPEGAGAANPDTTAEPEPVAADAPTPDANIDLKTEVAVAPKTEAKVDSSAEIAGAPKSDTKTETKAGAAVAPKPGVKVEPKPETAVAPKPDAKVDPSPATATAPTPHAHVEPMPPAHAESAPDSLKPGPQSP